MATINIGINGLGRIGRMILRETYERRESNVRVVAINTIGDPEQYAHLVKYDSVHGRFKSDISMEGGSFKIGGDLVPCYDRKDPTEIPWSDHNVHIVVDSTGVFKDKPGLGKHLTGTVKKVIMCAPGKDLDGTFVVGVNHLTYEPDKHHIVSNASCTTNCLAPMAKIIDEKFGILSGMMTTIHSYTGDQCILDAYHSDPRRARSAALSMIPTTTGAAKAVGLVIPKLQGKLDGIAIRVPTPNVSLTDLTCYVEKETSIEEVNAALKEASESRLKGILRFEPAKLVSADFMGMKESSCVDASLTNVIDKKTVKVVSWYDNEIGFSNRVIDLISHIGKSFS